VVGIAEVDHEEETSDVRLEDASLSIRKTRGPVMAGLVHGIEATLPFELMYFLNNVIALFRFSYLSLRSSRESLLVCN
jgi:hypothetical protein